MSSAVPPGLPDPSESRAVLIGCARYRNLDDLPQVEQGVRNLAGLLRANRLWGLPSENYKVVLNPAIPEEVERSIAASAAAVGPNGRLLVYFAGHSLIDRESGRLYFGLSETVPGATHTALDYDRVIRYMRVARSGLRTLILDCFDAEGIAPPHVEGCDILAGTTLTHPLLELLGNGIPGGPELLDLRTIHQALKQMSGVGPILHRLDGGGAPLVRNVASSQRAQPTPITHLDVVANLDDSGPSFVPRDHDPLLVQTIKNASQTSRLVVVMGPEASGKTRSALEAIRQALPDWQFWRPETADLLGNAAPELIPPRTVIWLDYIERFLLPLGNIDILAQSLLDLMSLAATWPIIAVGTVRTKAWGDIVTGAQSQAVIDLLNATDVIPVEPLDPDRQASHDVPSTWDVRTRGYGDRPAAVDLLRREAMTGALADLISPAPAESEQDRCGPTVVALDGPWGIGKTSLVRLVEDRLDEAPTVPAKQVPRLRAYQAAAALSGRGDPLWTEEMITRAAPETSKPPLITTHFEPWAHQTSEQVWAGLTTTLLGAVEKTVLPRQSPATERYWFQRNIDRVDRIRLRRALHKGARSPLLTVSALALAVPLIAQMARSIDTYRVAGWLEIAGSNIALIILATVLLGAIGHTILRYFRPAADFLPPEMFTGPVPNGANDEALRDPYHNARSGYLYLTQHDVFAVLDDVRQSGHHMVVFIDDLDRCTPRATAEVFEAINLFVTRAFPVTRFVLCLDTTTVATHLDDVYAALKNKPIHGEDPSPGWSYLRKLIQLPIPIPPIVTSDVTRLLNNLLGETAQDAPPPTAQAAVQPPPPVTTSPPPQVPGTPTTEEVTAVANFLEHDEGVRQLMSERLQEQRPLTVREAKRILTIWQYYVRVLIRLGMLGPELVEQARHLVILAEIIARWPAVQLALHRRVAGEHGLELLAKATDDWTWARTLRRLDLHTAPHLKCTNGLRDLLERYDGEQVAALAARLT